MAMPIGLGHIWIIFLYTYKDTISKSRQGMKKGRTEQKVHGTKT